jgi:uncharacterized membrane protein
VILAPAAEPDWDGQALDAELERRFPQTDWEFYVTSDRFFGTPATTDLVDAARRRLLDEDWDLTLVVTESPLRVGRRALTDFASHTHRVGLVSLPALGALKVRRRLREALVELVSELVADPEEGPSRATFSELRDVEARPGELAPFYALRVLASNVRLLGGMIRANRPWRFAARLYRVLVTALATAVFALVTGEVWELADALGTPRLVVGTVAALAITAVTIILAHGLWERAPNPRVRQDVVLFNVATLVTVVLGIVTLYVALFIVTLLITALFVAPSVLESTVGHGASLADFAELGWLVSSIATVGGALGGALETGSTVREATYAGDEDEPEPEPASPR